MHLSLYALAVFEGTENHPVRCFCVQKRSRTSMVGRKTGSAPAGSPRGGQVAPFCRA